VKVTITPESKVVKNHQIACYETDGHQRLKPSAFMDLAQEMAYLAAEAMHFGYDELGAEGKAWVLSRFHYRFDDVPYWREKLEIQTWHKGPSGPFYLRDFALTSPDGRRRVSGTSSWIILDVASRRMCRTSEVTEMIPESTICHDNAIVEPAEKVQMPKGAVPEFIKTHKIGYSDIDLLGHTNNARYVILAMDCIPYETVSEKPIKDLRINFNHETKEGESLQLYHACEGLTHYVEGKVDDSQAFIVKIDF